MVKHVDYRIYLNLAVEFFAPQIPQMFTDQRKVSSPFMILFYVYLRSSAA